MTDGENLTAPTWGVSQDRSEESSEAKARWFQGLSMEDRMGLLVELVDFVMALNPSIQEAADAEPPQGRVRVLGAP
jgi:hypothetical protein